MTPAQFNEYQRQADEIEREKQRKENLTAVEWLVQQLRQLAHNPKTHLGMGDIRVTQGYIDEIEKQAKQMEAEQSKIPELSDAEIRQASSKALNENHFIDQQSWYHGACWYREQLKQRQ